jgi:hypothetical protein
MYVSSDVLAHRDHTLSRSGKSQNRNSVLGLRWRVGGKSCILMSGPAAQSVAPEVL